MTNSEFCKQVRNNFRIAESVEQEIPTSPVRQYVKFIYYEVGLMMALFDC